MKSFRSNKTETRTSSTSGHGFFAKENILKGEIVAIRSGHIVDLEEVTKLDAKLGDFSLQISNDHFLSPRTKEEIKDIALYINHSCDPNVGLVGQVSYIAMRDIKAGEELCLDYAMAMNTDYELKCNCDSDKCRGTITGYDWKLEELQKRYKGYFSSYISEMIDKNLA